MFIIILRLIHSMPVAGRGRFSCTTVKCVNIFHSPASALKVKPTPVIIMKNENQPSLNIWGESCQSLLEGKDIEEGKVIKIKNKPVSHGINKRNEVYLNITK